MKYKLVVYAFLLMLCINANAQDIADVSKKMSFPIDLPTPRFIINLPDTTSAISLRVEDLKSVTTEKLGIIKNVEYVELCFSNQIELNQLIKELINYKNLKYLSFTDNRYSSGASMDSLTIPKEILNFTNLIAIKFAGEWSMNYNKSLAILHQLPKLEFFFFQNITQKIPEELRRFRKVRGLSIQNSNSIELPEWINQFPKLESLSIGLSQYKNKGPNYLDFSTVFKNLANIKNLKALYISNLSHLNERYDDIAFKKLERLKISGARNVNKIGFFKFLSNHKKLRVLALEQLYIDTLKTDLVKLKKLKSLIISGSNEPLTIDFNLSELRKLETLEFRNFKGVSTEIQFPKGIINLDLSGSKISVIPGDIAKLSHLESLNLKYNALTILPNNLNNLKKLAGLDLSANLLTSLPNNIGELSSLKNLNLMANPLKELPLSIGQLQNLKLLDLTYCDIKALPENFGELKSLEVLKLERNFLTSLPKSFTRLVNLNHANISSNNIESLPADFGSLINLKLLNLTMNNISALPPTMGELKKLEELYLFANNLSYLPEELSNLIALKKLNISNFSDAQQNVYNLRGIYRKDNPSPKQIISKNTIQYLPKDLSKWSSLTNINMENYTSLKELELFKSLFTVSSKAFTVDLENANINTLPINGWANFNVGVLNLKHNKLTSIPSDIVNARYLISYNFNENRLPFKPINYNSYTANKYEKLIGFKEFGFITATELPQVDSMALAYAEKSNNHYYRKEYAKTVEYAALAKSINSKIADLKIYKNNLGEAKYWVGDYRGAIADLTTAIKRDTSGGSRIMYFVRPDFEYRAKSFLKLGDTINAIKDYETLAVNHWSDTWAEVGILYKRIGDEVNSKNAFDKGVIEYQDYIDFGKKQKNDVDLKQLSLLEVLIVSENFGAAEKYAEEIKSEIKNKANLTLLIYLTACAKIGNNKLSEINFKTLNETILTNKKEINSWGYELFYKWLRITKIDKPKADLMRMLTDSIKPIYD